jgi:cobalt-precorrin-7 (C5)-methyltransferase
MNIVGVGAGPDLLTKEAISAIGNAEIIFGSQRAIELAKEHINCRTQILTDYTLQTLPENAVVLSTGDPMLSGLGKYARKGDEIITGISSLQLACARLCLDIETLSVITAHSRNLEMVKKRLLAELADGKNVFLLPDPSFGAKEIGEFLKNHALTRKIIICQRLGYPDEKIITGTNEEPPSFETDMYCLVITTLNDSQ